MSDCCQHHHHEHPQKTVPHLGQNSKPTPLDATAKAIFLIQNMDCPSEEQLIRAQLGQMEGIAALQFNLLQRELTVQHRLPAIAPIIAALNAIDMRPRVRHDSLDTRISQEQPGAVAPAIPRRKYLLVGSAAVAALAAEWLDWYGGHSHAVIALALLAIGLGGLGTLKKAWIALRHRSLNMNFLMALAVIGAACIGQWPEAAVVIVLFTLAEMIESLTLERARQAIANLMTMAPEQATVWQDAGWVSIATNQIAPGSRVRVKPGERIALDGVVTEGAPLINQAPITGESMPVSKTIGAQVFAGSINGNSSFDYRVTALPGESLLARIVNSVQQAQAQRAPTQRFVDQFARRYIPAVVASAILVALLPPLLLGAAFHPWLYKALVLLVIACPCALVISTPLTIVSALAAAARHGILIKGGIYLEQGRQLKALALDKTGTITSGKALLTDLQPLTRLAETSALLRQAAALAAGSDHPVSAAISTYWHSTRDPQQLAPVSQLEVLNGLGIKARSGSSLFYLGNHRLVHELGMCDADLEAALLTLEQQGKTTVILCRDGQPQLLLAVAETVRPSSAAAIAQLQARGIALTMLSGDNADTVQAIARSVGIHDARSEQLPQDKLDAMHQLIARYGCVGMVGDGINDAPALARAQIGFAMGAAGSDTALETADVALMDDDLRKIGDFIGLSQRTHHILLQNISIALAIKVLFLGLALAGESSLWMAVFADMGSSLIVIFNGLRLLRYWPAR